VDHHEDTEAAGKETLDPGGRTWVCTSQGFPALPFLVDTDLTRTDGIITCKRISETQALRLAARAYRLYKILRLLPLPL
jgi:hypothetical protein